MVKSKKKAKKRPLFFPLDLSLSFRYQLLSSANFLLKYFSLCDFSFSSYAPSMSLRICCDLAAQPPVAQPISASSAFSPSPRSTIGDEWNLDTPVTSTSPSTDAWWKFESWKSADPETSCVQCPIHAQHILSAGTRLMGHFLHQHKLKHIDLKRGHFRFNLVFGKHEKTSKRAGPKALIFFENERLFLNQGAILTSEAGQKLFWLMERKFESGQLKMSKSCLRSHIEKAGKMVLALSVYTFEDYCGPTLTVKYMISLGVRRIIRETQVRCG